MRTATSLATVQGLTQRLEGLQDDNRELRERIHAHARATRALAASIAEHQETIDELVRRISHNDTEVSAIEVVLASVNVDLVAEDEDGRDDPEPPTPAAARVVEMRRAA